MKYVADGKICTMKDAPALTLEERIQRMEDTEAIKGIMYHYTRCTDNLDAEGIAAMFTESGTFAVRHWAILPEERLLQNFTQNCFREQNPVHI